MLGTCGRQPATAPSSVTVTGSTGPVPLIPLATVMTPSCRDALC